MCEVRRQGRRGGFPAPEGGSARGIWRRRQCRACRERWTTVESAYPSDAALRSLDTALMLSASGIADARRILKEMLSRGGVG